MLKKDLIIRNPLRLMGNETDDIIPEGGIGAILSRAGVGKTAMVVQLALNTMLRGKNVLHISLNDPIGKVTLWYRELFEDLAREYNVEQMQNLWETILPYRIIMTFKVMGFSVPKLEERLTDLTEQDIFNPAMIIIDGFSLEDSVQEQLSDLKKLAKRYGVHIWLTMHTHREEVPGPEGFPAQLASSADILDVALELKPEGSEINIVALKGTEPGTAKTRLLLDPGTMLIKNIRA